MISQKLVLFIRICRLFENVCFLIGSAYFVSGSYAEIEDDDDVDAEHGHGPAKKAKKNLSDDLNTPFIENNDRF